MTVLAIQQRAALNLLEVEESRFRGAIQSKEIQARAQLKGLDNLFFAHLNQRTALTNEKAVYRANREAALLKAQGKDKEDQLVQRVAALEGKALVDRAGNDSVRALELSNRVSLIRAALNKRENNRS